MRLQKNQSCLTLYDPMDCSQPVCSVHGIFQCKSNEVGCHFLLQGIFLIQGSNPNLLQVSCTASGFFFFFFYTTEPPGKPPKFLSVLFPMSPQYKGQDTFGATLPVWFFGLLACFMNHSGFMASEFVHMFPLTISLFYFSITLISFSSLFYTYCS